MAQRSVNQRKRRCVCLWPSGEKELTMGKKQARKEIEEWKKEDVTSLSERDQQMAASSLLMTGCSSL